MASKHLVRGVLAGVAGGLAAAWMMNEFSGTVGKKISDTLETPAEKRLLEAESDGEDATMKAADKIVETVTGGRHLTYEQREVGGPIVHYTMGALTGGVYGALAEYSTAARAGLRHDLRWHPLCDSGHVRRSGAGAGPVAGRISRQLMGEPAGVASGLRCDHRARAPDRAHDSLAPDRSRAIAW